MGFTLDVGEIPKRVFVIVVTLATVLPRMPLDEPVLSCSRRFGWITCPSFHVGGDLSRPFRKLLLVICLLHLLRSSCNWPAWAILFLKGAETVALSFLSLLTPYLLRVWLSQRINLPGGRRPGMSLMPWVYAVIALSVVGVLLRTWFGREEYWMAKKLADGLSFIPVIRTLGWYNGVTTGQARYAGRGSVLSQLFMIGEYFNLLAVLIFIVINVCSLMGVMQVYSQSIHPKQRIIIQALFAVNHWSQYTRVLFHSVLLNSLDETYQLHTAITTGQNATGHRPGNEGHVESNEANGVAVIEEVEVDNNIEMHMPMMSTV